MKILVAVVGIVCLALGVYLGWTFKPTSAEGLLLSTLGGLTEGQAAAERAEYEIRIEQAELVLTERTAELDQAREEREQAEELAVQAGEQADKAQARLIKTREEVSIARTRTIQAVVALRDSPEDATLLRAALTVTQHESVALRIDNASLRSALDDTKLQVVAEQATSYALRGELIASAKEKVAIMVQRDLATDRVDQLTKKRVRVGPGVVAGWSVFGGSLKSANVFVGLSLMWG